MNHFRLRIQDEYNQKLQQAEDRQIAAQDKREVLFDFKSSFFKGISNLRLERDEILTTMNDKKQRHRSFTIQPKPLDPPVKFFVTLEQDT